SPCCGLLTRLAPGQHAGAVAGDRDRVLAVGRQAAVAGVDGPAVVAALDVVRARRDHRLDREHHARGQLGAAPGRAVVGDLRILVHVAADAVADQAADDAKAARLDGRLHRVRDVAEPVAGVALGDRRLQTLVAGRDQVGRLRGRLA